MSTLNFPRVYVHGQVSWDPSLSNNFDVYDPVNARIDRIRLLPWVTNARRWSGVWMAVALLPLRPASRVKRTGSAVSGRERLRAEAPVRSAEASASL